MKGTPIGPDLIQTEAFDIPAEAAGPGKEQPPQAEPGGRSDSGPGYARFTADDSPKDIERKMRDAFGPLRLAMATWQESMMRAYRPNHRWRDVRTGRFIPKPRT